MLPLALLPQLFLSRPAIGDGAVPWRESSSFSPIGKWVQYMGSQDASNLDRVMAVVTLPLISRPAPAVLDMPGHDMPGQLLAAEWLYFLVLLLGHLLLLYVLFRAVEPGWQRTR